MPVSPHPITVTLKDTDNSTAKSGASVILRNCTKKTVSDTKTTNASGQAIFDLANLPLGDGQTAEYESGDIILIIAYDNDNKLGPCHDCERYSVTGNSKSSTLYLNPTAFSNVTTISLKSLIAGNTDASNAYYVKVFDYADGNLIAHAEVPASNTVNLDFGHGGKRTGGYVLVRENQAVIVTTVNK